MTSVDIPFKPNFPNTDHFRAPRSRPQDLAPPRSLNELVKGLHYVFGDDHVDVEAVKAYIASYKSNKEDWIDKVKFDECRQVLIVWLLTLRIILTASYRCCIILFCDFLPFTVFRLLSLRCCFVSSR